MTGLQRLPGVQELIKRFDLIPHFEGGFYKETFRSQELISLSSSPTRILNPTQDEPQRKRNLSTEILYLLPLGQVSRLHRIRSEETWHYYMGNRHLSLLLVDPCTGDVHLIELGHQVLEGQEIQYTVPSGVWFGAFVGPVKKSLLAGNESEESEYALVGCTVAPGFDLQDFEFAIRSEILQLKPEWSEGELALLEKLTCDTSSA
jgi:predicted cupin superfamily sugar epimerase